MTKTRIYKVTSRSDDPGNMDLIRLVRTTTANAAERHVITETVTASPASADDVAELMDRGVKVETPGGEGE